MRPSFTRTAFGIQIEWPEAFAWESEEERAYCTAPFTAREALSMLSHLTDDDVELLGFASQTSHPRNMIAQSLVVPPPSARPAIYSSEGSRSRGQNDLTVRFIEVLRRSHEVAAAKLRAERRARGLEDERDALEKDARDAARSGEVAGAPPRRPS